MYLDDLKIGAEIDIQKVRIDKNEMLEFAKRYDNIPIHTDEEYAKKTKFKRVIAPGVMSFLTVWAKFLENDIFGDELIAGKSMKIEWFAPVFADDVLEGKATISNITRRNPYNGIAELKIDIYNQNDDLVISNVTESVVKYRTE